MGCVIPGSCRTTFTRRNKTRHRDPAARKGGGGVPDGPVGGVSLLLLSASEAEFGKRWGFLARERERERHSSEAQTPIERREPWCRWAAPGFTQKWEKRWNHWSTPWPTDITTQLFKKKKRNVEGKESRERGETECRVMKNEHVRTESNASSFSSS